MERLILLACVFLAACTGDGSGTDQPDQSDRPAVFIGDSITELWNVDAVNVGIRGQVTEEMLARFDADVLSRNPRLVHILGGTNDVHREAPSTYHLQEMANRAAAGGAQVVIGTIPPVSSGANDAVLAWNAEIRSIARSYGYTLIDYYPELLDSNGEQDPLLFADPVHLSRAGYSKMCERLTDSTGIACLKDDRTPTCTDHFACK